MQKAFFSLLLAAVSNVAMADWASGGGELVQDAQNPWFIQNTPVVRYCTLYDGNYYHQSHDVTEQMLDRAIRFWTEEFRYGQTLFEPRVEVATQRFVHTDCLNGRQDVDIVFQFGFLDAEQLTFVKDPTRYAALAIRTDYDKVNLRGKGFVYVAADAGPYRFRGDGIVTSPWTYGDGSLLYWTLVHELGHVFGLRHTTQRGEAGNVMAGDFIETIMAAGTARAFALDRVVNSVFRIRSRNTDIPTMECRLGPVPYLDALKEFFGIDPSWKCFGTKIVDDGLEIYAKPGRDASEPEVLIGTARVNKPNGEEQSFTLVTDALHFWLPSEQLVFPGARRVYTPSYYVADSVATYRSVSGSVVRQMSFTLDPTKHDPLQDDLKIGGSLGDKLYINLKEGI